MSGVLVHCMHVKHVCRARTLKMFKKMGLAFSTSFSRRFAVLPSNAFETTVTLRPPSLLSGSHSALCMQHQPGRASPV